MGFDHSWAAKAHICALNRLLERRLEGWPEDEEAWQACMALALMAEAWKAEHGLD
ncbi:hypothetical protein [Synechococcus sp. CBW1107]|uniref:hypothetical protein n=1 Tax=Synechococcus sp. CBW1107 TaxID=2789857 RepID=UPI002AD44E31|nr:hypothetical protein [Synechococcus sp. CBW1107]CAK6701038.1 hypothetical protein IFHNHDMJ_02988 [Synechococcus sp. CBW1107]